MHLYVDHVRGIVRALDLPSEQPGYSTEIAGRLCIFINGNDSVERRRFTICHEIGHKVLNLPSEHADTSALDYSKRPWNEILCDVFAAELMLPYNRFKPSADLSDISFAALDGLAVRFEASVTSTGSRFAAVSDLPCAFVLSQAGIVRYASRSKALREINGWINLGTQVPAGSCASFAHRQRLGEPKEIAADLWFTGWRRGGFLLEQGRHLPKWDQCLTLIWSDDDEVPHSEFGTENEDGDPLLKELDGKLPWPGKRRSRR